MSRVWRKGGSFHGFKGSHVPFGTVRTYPPAGALTVSVCLPCPHRFASASPPHSGIVNLPGAVAWLHAQRSGGMALSARPLSVPAALSVPLGLSLSLGDCGTACHIGAAGWGDVPHRRLPSAQRPAGSLRASVSAGWPGDAGPWRFHRRRSVSAGRGCQSRRLSLDMKRSGLGSAPFVAASP